MGVIIYNSRVGSSLGTLRIEKKYPNQILIRYHSGFGNGLVQSAGFIALTSGVTNADMAVASSGYYLSSNIGTVFGMAATNAIFQANLRQDLERQLEGYESRREVCT
jgi:hypothetical protein